MRSDTLARHRRRFGLVVLVAVVLGLAWFFAPGLPVLWGPYAGASVKAAGQLLFEHEWQPNDPLAHGDGLGPLFNARSCAACHFQAGLGGGGGNQNNVVAFDVVPNRNDPQGHAGVVHNFAVNAALQESRDLVRRQFPILPKAIKEVGGCYVEFRDFDPLHVNTLNTPALFGAGWIDRISTNTITNNRIRRLLGSSVKEFQLDFDSIGTGRPHVLPDGRIGKFGWKAQFATLREFVAAACANELGLGNPLMEQARPLASKDFPAAKPDLDRKQFTALVAFVDTLPRPVEVLPDSARDHDVAVRGKELFSAIGCAVCHTPDMGGVRGVYSDFLLHVIDDPTPGGTSYGTQTPEVPLPPETPRADEWKTPPLWGVADSAPYFHDGSAPTLLTAILRHKGDAASVGKAYEKLQREDHAAVIAFLQTLKAPPDATPVQVAGR
jgi:mono/diheme cytochrome c family protein